MPGSGTCPPELDICTIRPPPAALRPQVRQCGPGELDRADQVDLDLAVQELVGDLLGRAEHAEPGVGDDHIDPVEGGERLADHAADRGGIGHVQGRRPQAVAVLGRERRQGVGAAAGRRDALAPGEQERGELVSESRCRAGDEPGPGCHAHVPS
jgi:hypothetical protein